MERNDVTSFFYYMWNAWGMQECKLVFKDKFWKHFWDKWCGIYDKYGIFSATEHFYAELSDDNRNLLVTRALQMYDGRKNIYKPEEQ